MTRIRRKVVLFLGIAIFATTLIYVSTQISKYVVPRIVYKPMRVLLFSVTLVPGNSQSIDQAVSSIQRIVKDNPDIEHPIVFVGLDARESTISLVEQKSIKALLKSIPGDPIFVYGENISSDPSLQSLVDAGYENFLIDFFGRRTAEIIKADSTTFESSKIQHITGHTAFNPDLTFYAPSEEPKKQYDWLSSFVGKAHTASILLTQKNIDDINDVFQKKFVDVICSSRISLYIHMSRFEDTFRTGACPGYSFSMLNAPEHRIVFLGVQTDKAHASHYKEIVIKNQSVDIIDHKL